MACPPGATTVPGGGVCDSADRDQSGPGGRARAGEDRAGRPPGQAAVAFGGPAPLAQLPLRRTVYAGALAYLVTMTQALHEEISPDGLRAQVVCPGLVATEFHERQGLDLSAVPRMSAQDVVTASLRGLELGEVVCAPGVEDASLLDAVFRAGLAAFGAQRPELARRYRGS